MHSPSFRAAALLLASCIPSRAAAWCWWPPGPGDCPEDTASPTTAPTFLPTTDNPTFSPTTTTPTSTPTALTQNPSFEPTRTTNVPNSSPSPTSAPTIQITTTLEPTAANVTDQITCPDILDQSTEIDSSATLYYSVVSPETAKLGSGLFCGRLEAESDGWISIGFSLNGRMIGSQAVIGIPSESTVLKYDLTHTANLMPEHRQTLSGTSIEERDGMVIMEFVKLLVEEGEVPIRKDAENKFIYAKGSEDLGLHTAKASFDLNLSSGDKKVGKGPNMMVWLAHGVMGFLAWAVLVPISVSVSLFRDRFPQGPLWFNLHRSFNATAYLLLIILFSIAVKYTPQDFSSRHGRIGLTMLILTTIQMVRGIIRPRLTYPGSDKEKTMWRKGWEAGHRFLGALLLLLGFSQMSSGIKLFSTKYSVSESNESKVMIMYWMWVVAIFATIVVGVWHSKIRKPTSNEPSFASPAVDGIDADVDMPKDIPSDVESDDVSSIGDIVYGPPGTPPRLLSA